MNSPSFFNSVTACAVWQLPSPLEHPTPFMEMQEDAWGCVQCLQGNHSPWGNRWLRGCWALCPCSMGLLRRTGSQAGSQQTALYESLPFCVPSSPGEVATTTWAAICWSAAALLQSQRAGLTPLPAQAPCVSCEWCSGERPDPAEKKTLGHGGKWLFWNKISSTTWPAAQPCKQLLWARYEAGGAEGPSRSPAHLPPSHTSCRASSGTFLEHLSLCIQGAARPVSSWERVGEGAE